MIDPITGWFEIVQYNEKCEAIIANLVYQSCLCGYTRPTMITYDRRDGVIPNYSCKVIQLQIQRCRKSTNNQIFSRLL